mmetsp:Transcript_43943/g.140820  ORF Transcript_43943/g.140820 Transcript_43943/m.140820 type:complete len:281 (+) Transcript_43943:744-1586(+)
MRKCNRGHSGDFRGRVCHQRRQANGCCGRSAVATRAAAGGRATATGSPRTWQATQRIAQRGQASIWRRSPGAASQARAQARPLIPTAIAEFREIQTAAVVQVLAAGLQRRCRLQLRRPAVSRRRLARRSPRRPRRGRRRCARGRRDADGDADPGPRPLERCPADPRRRHLRRGPSRRRHGRRAGDLASSWKRRAPHRSRLHVIWKLPFSLDLLEPLRNQRLQLRKGLVLVPIQLFAQPLMALVPISSSAAPRALTRGRPPRRVARLSRKRHGPAATRQPL